MNRYRLMILMCFLFCLSNSFLTYAQTIEIVNRNVEVFRMEEFHQRGGLPNFFKKLNSQRRLHIGYIGGSITEAKEGWADLVFNWFKLNYPLIAFCQTNIAIGGTGSDLGVFRIERDLLVYNPDLVFVEYAVNDSGRNSESVMSSMEGIVRKIWANSPLTDICFVYTTAKEFVPDMVMGKQMETVKVMEELADYYQIPSINMGLPVARLYASGELALAADPLENSNRIVFSKDGVHPLLESGHPIYASLVGKYLKQMSDFCGMTNCRLIKPYVKNNWERAKMINVSEALLLGDWKILPKEHMVVRDCNVGMPVIYQGEPGASLKFKFKGNVFGFFDCIGPGTGIIDVSVDGKMLEQSRFDPWCSGYRKHCFLIDNLSDGIHEVEVLVTNKVVDKRKILQTNNIVIDDLKLYSETCWYPTSVLIIGELVNE